MRKIEKFIYENFYNINEYLISGSYLSEEDFNEFSDIDIILFSKNNISPQNHTILIDNKKVQFIVVPLITLSEAFFNDYYSFKGSFTHMISNSVIKLINNKGSYKMLEHIQNHARKLSENRLPFLNEREIYQLKYIITNYLLDIKGNKNKKELIFCILELLNCIASLKMHMNNSPSVGTGKHKYRALKSLDYSFLLNMENSLQQYVTDKDINSIISFVEKELNIYGGPLNFYSKSNVLYKVYEDKLILSISRYSFNKNTLKIINFMKSIDKLTFNVFLYNTDTIYIQIYTSKNTINNFLIPHIEKFCITNNIFMNFPIREDTEFHLYHIINVKSFINIINKFQQEIIPYIDEYILSENKSIELSFHLLHKMKLLFLGDIEYIKFLNSLYKELLPYYYDDGYINSINKLINKIESTHNIFKEQFQANISDYDALFSKKENVLNIDAIITQLKKTVINTSFLANALADNNNWYLYKHFIIRCLSMLFISNSNKPFVIYSFLNLYKKYINEE